MSLVRRVLGVGFVPGGPWLTSNAEALKKLGVPSIKTMLLKRQAQWLGHVARMPNQQLARAALFGAIPQRVSQTGGESKGWRKGRYTSQAQHLIERLPEVDFRIWTLKAKDKMWWKGMVRKINADNLHTLVRSLT